MSLCLWVFGHSLELDIDARIGDIIIEAHKVGVKIPDIWFCVSHGMETYRDLDMKISDTDITQDSKVEIRFDFETASAFIKRLIRRKENDYDTTGKIYDYVVGMDDVEIVFQYDDDFNKVIIGYRRLSAAMMEDALTYEFFALVEAGLLDVNLPDVNGADTALSIAVTKGYTHLFDRLIEMGAKVNYFKNDKEYSVLWGAFAEQRVEMAVKIIEAGGFLKYSPHGDAYILIETMKQLLVPERMTEEKFASVLRIIDDEEEDDE